MILTVFPFFVQSVAPFPADDALDKTERDVAGTCSPWPLIGASLFLASKVLEEITVEKLKEYVSSDEAFISRTNP